MVSGVGVCEAVASLPSQYTPLHYKTLMIKSQSTFCIAACAVTAWSLKEVLRRVYRRSEGQRG